MSHFAKVDKQTNKVVNVINATQLYIYSLSDSEDWIQTSYNNNVRGKFAAIGDTYNKEHDVFIGPQPYPSWTLDASFQWIPPIPEPTDWNTLFCWDETNQQWLTHYSAEDVQNNNAPDYYLERVGVK